MQPAVEYGKVRFRKADLGIDTVEEGLPSVAGCHPGAIDIGDRVVDPDER